MAAPLPSDMTVIEIVKPGGPEALQPRRRPVPAPGPGEVLIQVSAAGVNRPDVLQRQGGYPPPPGASDIPGLEVAGRIVTTGEGAAPWQAGDPVCALVAGGGYAEYCVAPAPQCLPVPGKLDMTQAAALPETFFTVWTNVFDRGRLTSGESFLVHGGSSGIGTTAIQLAHAFGAQVIATAGSAEKCEACRKLGADVAIDYREEDFVIKTMEATEGRGADVILDFVGGSYAERHQTCLAEAGRWVVIGLLGGAQARLDLAAVLRRRWQVLGLVMRTRSLADKCAIVERFRSRVLPEFASGRLSPQIDRVVPWSEVRAAHQRMEENANMGKIVLEVD